MQGAGGSAWGAVPVSGIRRDIPGAPEDVGRNAGAA